MMAREHQRDDALRVALIGYGLAGSVFHAPLIATTPGLRLVIVVTADATRRQQAERDNPGVPVGYGGGRGWGRFVGRR